MKPRLRNLLKSRKIELRQANPKSRDRIRHRVRVLEVVQKLRKEIA